jgi:hypothetical protein
MHEYNLRVGNVVLSLEFRHERHKRAFVEYFRRPSDPRPGDISLAFKFQNKVKGLAEIPNSLFLTKLGDGEGFSAADGLIAGRYSPSSGECELVVQEIILEGNFARIFEQILYQAYWSAAWRKGLDSMLLHSSGIERGGKGYAFTGKSGSGKSTVTGLSEGSKVLNDEITLIEFAAGTPTVSDTPFNGFFHQKQEGLAPLAALFLLEHAKLHRITRTRDAESVKTLAREIIPPLGLETALSPSIYWRMLDYAKRLSDAVPIFRMEFLPDPGFWRCIDEMEGKPDEREERHTAKGCQAPRA